LSGTSFILIFHLNILNEIDKLSFILIASSSILAEKSDLFFQYEMVHHLNLTCSMAILQKFLYNLKQILIKN